VTVSVLLLNQVASTIAERATLKYFVAGKVSYIVIKVRDRKHREISVATPVTGDSKALCDFPSCVILTS
jgi:hypothetical protein